MIGDLFPFVEFFDFGNKALIITATTITTIRAELGLFVIDTNPFATKDSLPTELYASNVNEFC